MARPIRVEYPGAVYHVMARGDHGEAIFGGSQDRKVFLETLGEACGKTGWRIHAYVLMGNHYHLLLETPEPNLVAGMKWLQGTYTQRYNVRHRCFGHLFQGRYKAVPIDSRTDENYFQVVSTYIHLNPARAGLIRIGSERLWRYGWSSYPAYLIRASRRPTWLRTAEVLGSLRLGPADVRGYEAYIEARMLELATQKGRRELSAEWNSLRHSWYLGGEHFREKLQRHLAGAVAGRRRESHSGLAKGAHDQAAAQAALHRAQAVLGFTEAQLRQMPKSAPLKMVLAWWLRQRSTVSLRWLAERLAMGHWTRVSQAIGQVKRGSARPCEKLKRQMARLATEKEADEVAKMQRL